MDKNNVIKIDVAHVLKTRAPKTKVPKFIVNYLRRIVHEDEFNEFFKKYPDKKNLEFIEAAFGFCKFALWLFFVAVTKSHRNSVLLFIFDGEIFYLKSGSLPFNSFTFNFDSVFDV